MQNNAGIDLNTDEEIVETTGSQESEDKIETKEIQEPLSGIRSEESYRLARLPEISSKDELE